MQSASRWVMYHKIDKIGWSKELDDLLEISIQSTVDNPVVRYHRWSTPYSTTTKHFDVDTAQISSWINGEWHYDCGWMHTHYDSSSLAAVSLSLSMNCICVKGKRPLTPLHSPSHCPVMFMAVTFTSSPICGQVHRAAKYHGHVQDCTEGKFI